MNLHEQRRQLEALLPEARRKAQHARDLAAMPGYADYREWVARYTEGQRPEIRSVDQLAGFVANALIHAGMRFAGTYFDAIQQDEAAIRQQLSAFDAEADAENDLEDGLLR